VPVPAHLKPVVEKDGQTGDFLIGIKPGDVVFSQTETAPPTFATELYVVEALHRKSILNLTKNGDLIKVNASTEFEGQIGDRIWLEFPEDKLFVFDAKTSLRLSE
jgi:multiple sugar transport system ATP-binding protein